MNARIKEEAIAGLLAAHAVISILMIFMAPGIYTGLWVVGSGAVALAVKWEFDRRRARKDRTPALTRRQRFKLYIDGERQLMDDWEEAFDPTPPPVVRAEPNAEGRRWRQASRPQMYPGFDGYPTPPGFNAYRTIPEPYSLSLNPHTPLPGITPPGQMSWLAEARCLGMGQGNRGYSYEEYTQIIRLFNNQPENYRTMSEFRQNCRRNWERNNPLAF